jgi:hypothetical protein
MADLKGIASEQWYFRPAFIIKIHWAVFALVLTVILIVFAAANSDPFWTVVVVGTPAGLHISTLFFS